MRSIIADPSFPSSRSARSKAVISASVSGLSREPPSLIKKAFTSIPDHDASAARLSTSGRFPCPMRVNVDGETPDSIANFFQVMPNDSKAYITDETRTFVNRRELIRYYIASRNRVPWELDERGDWVGCYICAATMLRGIAFSSLRQHLPESIRNSDSDVRYIEAIACQIVGQYNNTHLAQFEPDIIGESFLLFFLNQKRGNINVIESLRRMCLENPKSEGQNTKNQTSIFISIILKKFLAAEEKDATREKEILSFFERLSRNYFSDEKLYVDENITSLNCFLSEGRARKSSVFDLAKQILLIEASKSGSERVVRLLIENGVKVNTIDGFGWTPLMWASYNGHTKVVNSLIRAGAAVNQSASAETALIAASYRGHTAIVVALINAGARINRLCRLHVIPNRYPIIGDDPLIIDYEAGRTRKTALMIACIEGHTTVADTLVKAGAKINAVNEFKQTALMFASTYGYVDTIKLLINAKADLGLRDKYKHTPLMLASMYRGISLDAITALLRNNAHINEKNKSGWTALTHACFRGNAIVAKHLIKLGADPNVTDKIGYTPLTIACNYNYEDTVKVLLDHTAELNPASRAVIMAIMSARMYKNKNIEDMIISKIRTIDTSKHLINSGGSIT